MVIPGEKDTLEKRYAKVIRRLGKGNEVEESSRSIARDMGFLDSRQQCNSL